MPQIINQAIEATKFIANYAQEKAIQQQVKRKSIFLSGHSAGSHLCAMILNSNWFNYQLEDSTRKLFKGVFHLSGIFDLTDLVKTSINDPLGLNETSAKALSPMLAQEMNLASPQQQQNEEFHLLVVVGEFDSPVFKEQGQAFCDLVSFLLQQIMTIFVQ